MWEETFCINFHRFKNMGAADTAIPHSMPPFGKQEWGIGYREEAGLLHHYLLATLDVDALGQAGAVGHPHASQVVNGLVFPLAICLDALDAGGGVYELIITGNCSFAQLTFRIIVYYQRIAFE